MFEAATDARTFNELMNKHTGTRGVVYAYQFPMHIQNGAEYMRERYDSVGREYATHLLDGNAKCTTGCMAHTTDHVDLTDMQRAYLSYMIDTADKATFKAAMQACLRRGAIPVAADILFSPHRAFVDTFKPAVYAAVAPAAVAPAAVAAPQSVIPSIAAHYKPPSPAAMAVTPPSLPAVHLNTTNQNGRSKRAKK